MSDLLMRVGTPVRQAWDRMENPVMGREFRARMRGGRSYLIQGVFTLVIVLAVLITYWTLVNQSGPAATPSELNQKAAETGRAIWTWGCLIEAFLLPLIVPAFTCGAITLEREREMLELLLLTRQSAFQVCLGKLGSGVGLGLVLVLSSVPVLAFSMVLGGISPWEIFACSMVLASAVVASGALGLAASSIAPKTVSATVASYLIIGSGMIGAPATIFFLQQAHQFQSTGSELGILAMLLACMLTAFPPGVGLGVVLIKAHERRTGFPPERSTWMLTVGLCWCAFLGTLYLPGATEFLQQGGALTMLHPVIAVAGVMFPNTGNNPVQSNLWWVCSITYLGVAIWCFYTAMLRVKRMRMG